MSYTRTYAIKETDLVVKDIYKLFLIQKMEYSRCVEVDDELDLMELSLDYED